MNKKTALTIITNTLEALDSAMSAGRIDEDHKNRRIAEVLFEIKWSASKATIKAVEQRLIEASS